MDKIHDNSDPKQTPSMLFRLFSKSKELDLTREMEQPAAAEQPIEMEQPAAAEPVKSAPTPEELAATIIAQEVAAEQASTAPKLATPELATPEGDTVKSEDDTAAATAREESPTEEEPAGPPPPVDAGITIRVSVDRMEAYVQLTPPQNGGAEIAAKNIRIALRDQGIVHGILDRAMFEIGMSKPYNKGDILVAQGTPRQDGADGSVTELFARELDLAPFQNPDGTVDFKRLNIVREIPADTLICTITPPTLGTNGVNVLGEPIKAMPGREKKVVRGNNTVFSEDGLQLLAEKSGHLLYKDGKFNVETTFLVDENVDNNTGNIQFSGDVLVKKDIREGYAVRSGGSVHVKGTVEGGSVYADGDIIIDGGFNGMKRGELETKQNVTSKFLQNCNVRAAGNIVSEAVINSVIFCDGSLTVTKSKGVIVGGRCTVLYQVEAKVIGSDVNTPTQITVGLSPTILAEKQELEKTLAELENSKDMLAKNLIYLERCAKMGKLSDKNIALQENCNKQKVLLMVREARARRRLEVVNTTIEEAAAGSMVKAQTVYPSTKVSIKSQSIMTKSIHNRVLFRITDGELVVGTY